MRNIEHNSQYIRISNVDIKATNVEVKKIEENTNHCFVHFITLSAVRITKVFFHAQSLILKKLRFINHV